MLAVVMEYDYVFCENGLVAYKDGKLIGNQVPAGFLTNCDSANILVHSQAISWQASSMMQCAD